MKSRKIGIHNSKTCNGEVVYHYSKGWAYRECKGCGASPDPDVEPVARRKQDDPAYRRASKIATSYTLSRHKQTPFRDEDEMIEYMREMRSDIYGY